MENLIKKVFVIGSIFFLVGNMFLISMTIMYHLLSYGNQLTWTSFLDFEYVDVYLKSGRMLVISGFAFLLISIFYDVFKYYRNYKVRD